MKRLYDAVIKKHLEEDPVMLFISGPRQIGKTTSSRVAASEISDHVTYLNWDIEDHREIILQGQSSVIKFAKFEELSEKNPSLFLMKFTNTISGKIS